MGQYTPLESDRRRAPRHVVDLPATVMVAGKVVPCRLANVSCTGALIASTVDLTVGTRIELDLPGTGPVEANVVRLTSTHIALMFPGVVVLAPRLAA